MSACSSSKEDAAAHDAARLFWDVATSSDGAIAIWYGPVYQMADRNLISALALAFPDIPPAEIRDRLTETGPDELHWHVTNLRCEREAERNAAAVGYGYMD